MVGMVCVAKQMPRANLLGIEDLAHVCSKVLPEIQRKNALIKSNEVSKEDYKT